MPDSREIALPDEDADAQASRMGKRGVGVNTAVTAIVLAGALLAALPLQWIWWRTAQASSLELVEALSEQISTTVRREWWERVVAAESAFAVGSTLLGSTPDERAIIRALDASLRATEVPSALTYASPESGRRLGTRGGGAIAITMISGEPGPEGLAQTPHWFEVPQVPGRGGPGVVYSGAAGSAGMLSVYIGFDRFSQLLADIPVGRSGGAFAAGPDGAIKAIGQSRAGVLFAPVAAAAAAVVAERPRDRVNIVEARRLIVDSAAYRVSFSPLEFNGWQFIVVVPEAEFLGEIQTTMRRALFGLLALAVALGIVAALIANRILSRPVAALTSDLRKIERFELEAIAYRPGRLHEFDQLSAAIKRMAGGLADFAKYIPTDLVRMLLAEGGRAVPGGETREITVMFADVAGFTKLSERMGTAVIAVISRYLDLVSGAVETHQGVVDKFIGDAVMALWGAPKTDADQAIHACLAALAAVEAVRASGLTDDRGEPLKFRIGIHSGVAVVGNIGSARRLNYTAIGDTVNLSSRLEGTNKVFGTAILISEATRLAAGSGISTREVAEVAVSGKDESVRIHELLGAGAHFERPLWAEDYETALAAYRARDFAGAAAMLDRLLAVRPEDGPALWLAECCRDCLQRELPSDWRGIVVLDKK